MYRQLYKIMFSKHTKFVKLDYGTHDITKSVTIYRFFWLPIFKCTKEMVDSL
jgi:hypothetical protein